MSAFTVWHCRNHEWFNYSKAVERQGTSKNTIEADDPVQAAEQYASADMNRRQSFVRMDVVVFDEHGKRVLMATVMPKFTTTFKVSSYAPDRVLQRLDDAP